MIGPREIERRFEFVAPDTQRKAKHQLVGKITKNTAMELDEVLPDSREKSLAFTHLEQVRMYANMAIATNVQDG